MLLFQYNDQPDIEKEVKRLFHTDYEAIDIVPLLLFLPLLILHSSQATLLLPFQYNDQPDIEKEVKRLFRTDNEAIDVKWEVVQDDDIKGEAGTGQQSDTGSNQNSPRLPLKGVVGK